MRTALTVTPDWVWISNLYICTQCDHNLILKGDFYWVAIYAEKLSERFVFLFNLKSENIVFLDIVGLNKFRHIDTDKIGIGMLLLICISDRLQSEIIFTQRFTFVMLHTVSNIFYNLRNICRYFTTPTVVRAS